MNLPDREPLGSPAEPSGTDGVSTPPASDVVAVTHELVCHLDAVVAATAAAGSQLRERVVSGPSLPLNAAVEGFWAGVRIRIEFADGTDETPVHAAVRCLRDRGLHLEEAATIDGHTVAEGDDGHGGELVVDWNPQARWLAVSVRTAVLPAPDGLEGHLELDDVFLDEVDPDGTQFRDHG